MEEISEVLDFWFAEDSKAHWFEPSAEFDRAVRRRLAKLLARAVTGELDHWQESAEGCLALCILLDQVPRHVFRGDARAYAADDKALAVAEHAVSRGLDRQLTTDGQRFLYLPFMHSEEIANQLRALALCEAAGLHETKVYAEEHLAVVRRFGRFPHRNAIVGRETTAAEAAFLEEAGKDYGQRPDPPPPASGRAAHYNANEGREVPSDA
jgi:uncharacterized protein (DUF924 family)